MEISAVYLLNRLGYRIVEVFRHWYLNGFLKISHWSLNFLERLDRLFALRVTIKHWFQPLYQDYSVIGYVWGFIFRTLRIVSGLAAYGFFIAVFAGIFTAWSAVPIYVLYQIIINL